MAQRRTRYGMLSEMEEGWRYKDAHSQYGARLTNLAMEFTKLDREDQEFLKILLSHEMSAEPGLRQGSGGERMDRVGPSDYSPLPRSVSGTPGGHIGCRLFDDNSTPRDGVAGASPYQTQGRVSFRDVEQTRSWSCSPGPVNSHSQRSDDQRRREIGGMRPGKSVDG